MSSAGLAPARADLERASLLAGLWCALLAPAFDRNTPGVDLGLFAIYAALHGLLAGVACWGLRLVWRRLRPAPARRRSRARSALALATTPLVLIAFALHRWPWSEEARTLAPAAIAGPTPVRRVLLLGMDGLDPDLLARGMARGDLPAFARLRREGASGRLATVSPHSPVVWTSIATGAPPERHHVLAYTSDYVRGTTATAPDPPIDPLGWLVERLAGYRQSAAVSSNERRVKAVWEILSECGLRSLVVNWWATYPAEPIDGIVISNRAIPWSGFGPEALAELDRTSQLVSPEGLLPLVRRSLQEAVEERDASGLRGQTFRYFELRDEIALRLFERLDDPSFALATLYLQGADTGSHAYTNAVFGGASERPAEPQVSPERAQELWQLLVMGPYRRLDATLARLMDALPPDAALIVLSDHGWRYDGTGHLDPPPGVFLARGRPFRAGATLDGHVYDVLPTLAWLVGVPRSRELPGRLLFEALLDPPDPREVPAIDAYGPRRARSRPFAPGSDAAYLERLRALGYLE